VGSLLYKWQDIFEKQNTHSLQWAFHFSKWPISFFFVFFFPVLTSYTCQVYHRKNKNKNTMKCVPKIIALGLFWMSSYFKKSPLVKYPNTWNVLGYRMSQTATNNTPSIAKLLILT
jgi:hypothetical protein